MPLQKDEKFLPKEPIDLPQPKAGPPLAEKEIEAHVVKTLLAWQAPGRPFRKRGRQYYLSGLLIMVLVEIILFLFSQYLLMVVVLSLVFVAFALVTVPPHNFHYRISTEGITIEDHSFLWGELYDFYFKRRDSVSVLHVRTRAFIPGELTLTLGEMSEEHVKSLVLPYLAYREVIKPTFMEKWGDWLARNFPLEKPPKEVAS